MGPVVVPTNRSADHLGGAIELAGTLGCLLVVLGSGASSATSAVDMARSAEVDILAVDTSVLPGGLLPRFASTEMLRGGVFEWSADTSDKRNLALLLMHLCGWGGIVFLDDDIVVPKPDDVLHAYDLLALHDVVGIVVGGYPDNSVTQHAYRAAGERREPYVGGAGALAVRREAATQAFFPKVYNEDLFFMMGRRSIGPEMVVGRVEQKPYDPFSNPARALSEEFGESLMDGLIALYQDGGRLDDAHEAYWRTFLAHRRDVMNQARAALAADGRAVESAPIIAALDSAHAQSLLIDAAFCVEYLARVGQDRELWREHLGKLSNSRGARHGGVAEVLDRLGLQGRSGRALRSVEVENA